MQLYDVGMSSLVVAELRHLAALAASRAFGSTRDAIALNLTERARHLGALVRRHLWNDALGAFTNLHANGSDYRSSWPCTG